MMSWDISKRPLLKHRRPSLFDVCTFRLDFFETLGGGSNARSDVKLLL